MKYKVTAPFSSGKDDYKVGDVVTKEQLGDAVFSVAFSSGCLQADQPYEGAKKATFYSDYNPAFAYSLNGSVFFNNKQYVSLQDSNTGNTPDKSPLFWKLS